MEIAAVPLCSHWAEDELKDISLLRVGHFSTSGAERSVQVKHGFWGGYR